jgi:hypothetical protein
MPAADAGAQARPAEGQYKPRFPLEKGEKHFFLIFFENFNKSIYYLRYFSSAHANPPGRQAVTKESFLLEARTRLE